MGPKVARVLILGILGLPFESPRTKCHLDVGLVERHKVYCKGEGGGLPPKSELSEFCESEFARGLF